MTRKWDCSDNAVAESFFATREKELMAHCALRPRWQTTGSIEQHIDSSVELRTSHMGQLPQAIRGLRGSTVRAITRCLGGTLARAACLIDRGGARFASRSNVY